MNIGKISSLLIVLLLVACSDSVSKGESNGTANNGRVRADVGPPNDGGGEDGGPSSTDMSPVGDVASLDVGECSPGATLSCVDETTRGVCSAAGEAVAEPCPAGEWCLFGECGDRRCVAGTLHCKSPQVVETCNEAEDGYENPMDCPEGTICRDGSCKSICDLGGKGPSYLGCEYWTVDLDQYTDPGTNPKPDEVPHAVVISNPGPTAATISFEPRDTGVTVNVADPVVPVGEARAFEMPRWDVDGPSLTRRTIRILASSPVIAHQFNPLNNENVFSNDASLLLPTTGHGKEYYVVNWPTQVLPEFMGFNPEDQHSYVTIIATTNGTTNLNITPTAQIPAGDQTPNFSPGATRSISMSYGQVLNLQANSGSPGAGNDLSGTHIISDKPVAVFAGHEEAVIGNAEIQRDTCCADHLEQQLFPVETWGTQYIAIHSPDRGDHQDHWRIVSAEDGVMVNFNPPQDGQSSVTLNAGEVHTFFSSESFEVNASGKIMVGQFLVSQEQTLDVTGDPAFILTVPTNQFRKNYHLLTPQGYSSDFVAIIRPAGAEVKLDGAAVADTEFGPIGSGNFERAIVDVQPGLHVLESGEQFGIQAYGFNNAVSYGYPGGLNLVGVDEPAP